MVIVSIIDTTFIKRYNLTMIISYKKYLLLAALCISMGTFSFAHADETQINHDIEVKSQHLADLKTKMDTNASQYISLSDEISKITAQTDINARNMQKNSSSTNFLMTILTASSISDAVKNVNAANTIQKHLNELNSQKKSKVSELNKLKTEQNNQVSELESELKSLGEQKVAVLAEAERLRVQAVNEAATKSAQSTQTTTNTATVTATPSTPISNGSFSGLDMNQTHGSVDINAVAAYMESLTGGSSATWAHIINNESKGIMHLSDYLTATHHGLFQSDTAYIGMTLAQQCANAKTKYDSQGFWNAWLRWEQ